MLRPMDAAEFTCQTLPSMRPQLRIAVVTETYPPEVNGVAMTLGRLVNGLQVRNHQEQLIRPRQHSDGRLLGLPANPALSRLCTRLRPDVAHTPPDGPLGWSPLAGPQPGQR